MPGWIAPTVALSLLVIAISVSVATAIILMTIKQSVDRAQSLAGEVAKLREDLAPTLNALRALGDKGIEVADMAQQEARQIIETTRRVRYDVERGVKRARRRLADFEAVVEVVQEEVEATAIDVTSTMHSLRTGAGMIGQLRKMIRPRRRGAA
ncbi:MAG TPA: hypothetical protein VGM77_14035 [Gemmatimonadales bacterium]|jgi:uncharacterized protein YhaN